jgi:plasmid stability protein
MSSITIHDLPPRLQARLEELAKVSGRSVEAEIIAALESVVPAGRPSDEEILRRADASRARSRELGITFTDEEIRLYKNMGRL